MKPFESVGFWFLPEAPDKQVAGTLSFSSDERLELRLSGAFREDWGHNAPINYDAIHGVVNDSPYGRYLSLFRCFSKSLRIGQPGLSLETIHSDFGFAGEAFVETDRTQFQKLNFGLTHLAEFFTVSGIALKPQFEPDGTGAGMDIWFRFPERLFCNAGGAKISTSFRFSTTSEQVPRSVAVQEFASFVVEDFGQRTTWEINTTYFAPLMALLQFASGSRSELLQFQLSGAVKERAEPVDVTCLFSPPLTDRDPPKPMMAFQFLFTLAHVGKERFEPFMQAWFALQKKHTDFVTLFFSYDYSKHQFLETRFVFLMSAVECFLRDELGESSKEFESIRKSTLEKAPLSGQAESNLTIPPAVVWAMPKLLNEFLSREWPIVEKVVGTSRERFVKELIATRNYIIHRGPRGDVVRGARLAWLTERLSACMKLTMLRMLGFTDDEVASMRDNYPMFSHLATISSPWDDSPESE